MKSTIGYKTAILLLWVWSITTVKAEYLEREVSLSVPPVSIAQWYKPLNRRQQFLHTMFSLRRSMQAIEEYVVLEDKNSVERWSAEFVKRYRSIGDMVPEWFDELELEWIDKLEVAVASSEWGEVTEALRKIDMSCSSCHKEYRATTVALYRTPIFDNIDVINSNTKEEISFKDAMKALVVSMNSFKIAYDDKHQERAVERLAVFKERVDALGESCQECHKNDGAEERILGEQTEEMFHELKLLAEKGDSKAGRKLGELSVVMCARCHAVHRTVADLRSIISR